MNRIPPPILAENWPPGLWPIKLRYATEVMTLKAEQPTLVVNWSCALCVREPTVSRTEAVVHCGADSRRAEHFRLLSDSSPGGKLIQDSDQEA